MKHLITIVWLFAGILGFSEELTVNIDGNKDDWPGAPLVGEIGGKGRGTFNTGIDATQLYVSNDTEYIYFFFGTKPSFSERYSEKKMSGNFCNMYIDIDNNLNSGCSHKPDFRFGKIKGYEFKLWMPIGQYVTPKTNTAYASYDLLPTDDDGGFTLSDPVFEKKSFADPEFVAHGKDGVEMKVPLNLLGIKAGDQINFLIQEYTHIFKEEGYTEGQYTIK